MKKIVLGILFGTSLFTMGKSVFSDEIDTMLRLYNPNSGEHFYTKSADEKNQLVGVGWKYEGVGWYAPTKGNSVYRMYNKNAGDHHYTLSDKEKNNLINLGWKYEGIGWYSDVKNSVPLYRAYNKNALSGSHNYTTSQLEQNNLLKAGWINEGISWYGVTESNETKYLLNSISEASTYLTQNTPQIGKNVSFVNGKINRDNNFEFEYKKYINEDGITWNTIVVDRNGNIVENKYSRTDITNDIQDNFPNYASFTGNWQKRTLNGIDVMTSTIPTSGLEFKFTGTELTGKFVKDRAGIQLVVQIDDQEPFYKWIDDNNNDTVIATGLADTEHVVKIFADSYFGTSMDNKHSFFTFKGALNVAGFNQKTIPLQDNRKVLFAYGDSFTAGGGGTLANSYATYAADLLNMRTVRVAQGGAGLVERSDRLFIPNLQQIAFQASNGVRTSVKKADLVTINIGTNDTKTVVTDAVYESNMRKFIANLKVRHSNAPIVLMGDWVNKYTAVCQKIGNDTDNVYFVDVSSWSYPKQDDLHPTDQGHKMIAEKLAEAIRKLNLN